jgi:glycosyltransferase involved in cell wall biosynthesis
MTERAADGAQAVLSVLVGAYNEQATIDTMLERVLARPEVLEVVVVDDGSGDATPERLAAAVAAHPGRVVVERAPVNRGKGASIRRAAELASGEWCLIQDADLEYDPDDYPQLLEPLLSGRADVALGARGFTGHSAFSFWFVMGNRLIDLTLNVLFDVYMRDISCCYKAMPTAVLRAMDLRSARFALDPEIVAKGLRAGLRLYEVPVTYQARSRTQGKKIRFRDGVAHLATIVRYRFVPVPSLEGGGRARGPGDHRPAPAGAAASAESWLDGRRPRPAPRIRSRRHQ